VRCGCIRKLLSVNVGVQMGTNPDITQLLIDYGEGNEEALEDIIPILYSELKRLAHVRMRNERPDHTLNTTGLVHEAYLKLVDINAIDWQSRQHFLAMASKVMRRILISYARKQKALKRGGDAPQITFDEEKLVPDMHARLTRIGRGASQSGKSRAAPIFCRLYECRDGRSVRRVGFNRRARLAICARLAFA